MAYHSKELLVIHTKSCYHQSLPYSCLHGNSLNIQRSPHQPIRGPEIEAEHSAQSPEPHRLLMSSIKINPNQEVLSSFIHDLFVILLGPYTL